LKFGILSLFELYIQLNIGTRTWQTKVLV